MRVYSSTNKRQTEKSQPCTTAPLDKNYLVLQWSTIQTRRAPRHRHHPCCSAAAALSSRNNALACAVQAVHVYFSWKILYRLRARLTLSCNIAIVISVSVFRVETLHQRQTRRARAPRHIRQHADECHRRGRCGPANVCGRSRRCRRAECTSPLLPQVRARSPARGTAVRRLGMDFDDGARFFPKSNERATEQPHMIAAASASARSEQ
jgi:hypothetical protein